jgi:hypothetical protein
MNTNASFSTYLFQPFRYIAGGKSLLFGLGILLLLALLSYSGNIYFDGVLDIHFGNMNHPDAFPVYASCVFAPWLVTTLVFYLTAFILSGKTVRIVDIAGTLACAKAPGILIALAGFIPAIHYTPDLNHPDMQELMTFIQENILWILIVLFVCILITIWSVVWMYNAYSVSCNLKGSKGIVSFIIALFISEVAAKILLILIFDF